MDYVLVFPLQQHGSDSVTLSPSTITAVALSVAAALVAMVVLSLLIYWKRQGEDPAWCTYLRLEVF